MVNTVTPDETAARRDSRRRAWVPWAVGLGVMIAVLGGGLLWFFGSEAPAAVDLDATATAITSADDASSTPAAIDGIEGTWTVDTTVGEFTVDGETTATFAGFRVDEVLSGIGSTTAVGRTPTVGGSLVIEGASLVSAEIVADLTAIVSDESRRDDAIQRALGTGTNSDAVFVLTEPVDIADGVVSGEPMSAIATGELTINGMVDGMILVTGTSAVDFADFEVETPTAPAVLSVDDTGVVEFQIWFSN